MTSWSVVIGWMDVWDSLEPSSVSEINVALSTIIWFCIYQQTNFFSHEIHLFTDIFSYCFKISMWYKYLLKFVDILYSRISSYLDFCFIIPRKLSVTEKIFWKNLKKKQIPDKKFNESKSLWYNMESQSPLFSVISFQVSSSPYANNIKHQKAKKHHYIKSIVNFSFISHFLNILLFQPNCVVWSFALFFQTFPWYSDILQTFMRVNKI